LCTSRIARDGEEVHIYITYLTLFAYWQSATRVFRENINLLQHGETINHKRDAQLGEQEMDWLNMSSWMYIYYYEIWATVCILTCIYLTSSL
jgi:hypothetical protein